MLITGKLDKMLTTLASPVNYQLPLGEQRVEMNPLIGQTFTLNYTGRILCTHCNRLTKKSFGQGYCYPCFIKLAECDSCIVKPELCHYAQGTCREPAWGEVNCMIPHIVYLANSSGIKVGITRHTQIPTRWMDQGATQALPILKVKSRLISGLCEVAIAEHVADKTDWRAMLKGDAQPLILAQRRDELLSKTQTRLDAIRAQHGADAVEVLNEAMLSIVYPVRNYPVKVSSFDFEKTPQVSGKLEGIKGQYLIFDTGVINIRKFTGYEVSIDC